MHYSSIDFGKILHTIFDSDQPFTIQSPKPNQSKALKNLNIILQNMFTGIFHSVQPFTIKSPANLNNIGLSIFHSDQSFKDTRFFIRINPSRIQRSMIIGLKQYWTFIRICHSFYKTTEIWNTLNILQIFSQFKK